MRVAFLALCVWAAAQLASGAKQYNDLEVLAPQDASFFPGYEGMMEEGMADEQGFLPSYDAQEYEPTEAMAPRFTAMQAVSRDDAGEETETEEEDDAHKDDGLSKHMQDLAMQTADLKKRAADLKDKERRLDESLKAAAAASDGEKAQPNASTVTALTLALPTLTKAPSAVAATEASRNATCPASSARVATLLATLKQGFTLSSEELQRTEGMINEAQSKYNESAGTALQEQKERDDEARKAAKESMARIEDDEKEALHIIHAEVAVAKSKSAGAHHLLSKEREIKESDELSEQKAHVRDAVSEIESALESRLAALRAQRRTVADTLADARKKRDSVLQDVQSVLSSAALSIRSKRGAIAKMAVVAGDLLSASARIEAGLKKDLSVAADHFKHHAKPVSSARSAGDTAKEEGVTDTTEKAHGATRDIHHFGLSPTEEEISKIKSAIVATDVNEDHVEAVHTAAAAHAISSDAAALNSGLAAAKTTADGEIKERQDDIAEQEKRAEEAVKAVDAALEGAQDAMQQHEFRQQAGRDADAAVMAATGQLPGASFLQTEASLPSRRVSKAYEWAHGALHAEDTSEHTRIGARAILRAIAAHGHSSVHEDAVALLSTSSLLQAAAADRAAVRQYPSMPLPPGAVPPGGYTPVGISPAQIGQLSASRTIGAVSGAVPFPVPDTPTAITPMGLGPLSSGLTPTEFAAIHGVPASSYYLPSDSESATGNSVYLRDVLAAASRLTGHGGLLEPSPTTPHGVGRERADADKAAAQGQVAAAGTPEGGQVTPEAAAPVAEQGQDQGQEAAEPAEEEQGVAGGEQSFRQRLGRTMSKTSEGEPDVVPGEPVMTDAQALADTVADKDAQASMDSLEASKAMDDARESIVDADEDAEAAAAAKELEAQAGAVDAEEGEGKPAASRAVVRSDSGLTDTEVLRLIKGGRAAARVAEEVAHVYDNREHSIHTQLNAVAKGLGPIDTGSASTEAEGPSFREKSGRRLGAKQPDANTDPEGAAALGEARLDKLPFQSIAEAVKTAEALVEAMHKRILDATKAKSELNSHLTELKTQRAEAVQELRALEEVDSLSNNAAALQASHSAELSAIDSKIFGVDQEGRTPDGMYLCADGSKAVQTIDCPDGKTALPNPPHGGRTSDGRTICGDGSSRWDGSNCPGGSQIGGVKPNNTAANAAAELAAARAAAAAAAEREARQAKIEKLQTRIKDLDFAIAKIDRLVESAQAAIEQLEARQKAEEESVDTLVAAQEQRGLLTDKQNREKGLLMTLIRDADDVRRRESERAEEARRQYERQVRTVMRSLSAIESAEKDALVAGNRARSLANDTVVTKGMAALRALNAELNRKGAEIEQDLKAALEREHAASGESAERRRIADKVARTRSDLLVSKHVVKSSKEVVEAAKMRAEAIRAVVEEERKMAEKQQDVRERAITAAEAVTQAHHAAKVNGTTAIHARARTLLASARRLKRLNTASQIATRLLRAYLQEASRAENKVLSLAAQGVKGAPADEPPQDAPPTSTELAAALHANIAGATASGRGVIHLHKPAVAAAAAMADADKAAATAANPDAFLQTTAQNTRRLRGGAAFLQVSEDAADESAEAQEASAEAEEEQTESEDQQEEEEEEASPAEEAGEEAVDAAAEVEGEAAEAVEEEAAREEEAKEEAVEEAEAAEEIVESEEAALSPEAKAALVAEEKAKEAEEAAAAEEVKEAAMAKVEKLAEEEAEKAEAKEHAKEHQAEADQAAAIEEANEEAAHDPAGLSDEQMHIDPSKDILEQPLPPLPHVTSREPEPVPEEEPINDKVARLERQGKDFAAGARRAARTARLLVERIAALRVATDEVAMRIPREEGEYFDVRLATGKGMTELCEAETEALDKYEQMGLQKGTETLEELAKQAQAIEERMAALEATAAKESADEKAAIDQKDRVSPAVAAAEEKEEEQEEAAAEKAVAEHAASEQESETADEDTEAADEGAEAVDEGAEAADEGAEAADEGAEAADEGAEAADEGAEAADEGAEAADEDPMAEEEAAEEAANAEQASEEADAEQAEEAVEAEAAASVTEGEGEGEFLQVSTASIRRNRRLRGEGATAEEEESEADEEADAGPQEGEAEDELSPAEQAAAAEAQAGGQEAADAAAAGEEEEPEAEESAEEQAEEAVDEMPTEQDQEEAEAEEGEEMEGQDEATAAEQGEEEQGSEAGVEAEESAAPAAKAKATKPEVLGYPPHEAVLEKVENAVDEAHEALEIAEAETQRLRAEYEEAKQEAVSLGAKLHEESPLSPDSAPTPQPAQTATEQADQESEADRAVEAEAEMEAEQEAQAEEEQGPEAGEQQEGQQEQQQEEVVEEEPGQVEAPEAQAEEAE